MKTGVTPEFPSWNIPCLSGLDACILCLPWMPCSGVFAARGRELGAQAIKHLPRHAEMFQNAAVAHASSTPQT